MEKLTYQQAYNKIIDAYFKDEIDAGDPYYCFCGTLCNNTMKWYGASLKSHFESHGYTGADFVRMEVALFSMGLENMYDYDNESLKEYEDALFSGMCAALEVLKEIHRSRGENVDEVQTKFVKIELAVSL